MKKGLIQFNAPVTLAMVILCVCFYLCNLLTAGYTNRILFSVYRSSFFDPLFYWRLFAHIFGHADWSHLSGNMMYILLLGPLLEEKYGSANLAFVTLLTGLITGIVHVTLFPYGLLGASGVVFAFIILSSITSVRDRKIPLTFIFVMVFYLGGEIIDGIFIRDQISNFAHIIGGLVGGACGYVLNYRK